MYKWRNHATHRNVIPPFISIFFIKPKKEFISYFKTISTTMNLYISDLIILKIKMKMSRKRYTRQNDFILKMSITINNIIVFKTCILVQQFSVCRFIKTRISIILIDIMLKFVVLELKCK